MLLPYNYPMSRNAAYAEDFEALVEVCEQGRVAIQTIKAITRAPWGERQQTANTWYEPLTDQAAIDLAVSWVLGRDGVFLNTVGDIHVLPKMLDAAERFTERPSAEVMEELEGLRLGAALRLRTPLLGERGLQLTCPNAVEARVGEASARARPCGPGRPIRRTWSALDQ